MVIKMYSIPAGHLDQISSPPLDLRDRQVARVPWIQHGSRRLKYLLFRPWGPMINLNHESKELRFLKHTLPRKIAGYIKETWISREIRGRISRDVMPEE